MMLAAAGLAVPVGVREEEADAVADAGVRAETGSDALPVERYLEAASWVSRRGVAGSCLL